MFQKTLGINDFYFGDPDSDWAFPLGAMQMLGKQRRVHDDRLRRHGRRRPAEVARHSLDFWLTTEDLPLPDNRVTVDGDGAISLRYTPTNLQAHARLRAKFESLLATMQCRDDVFENLSYLGGRLGSGRRRPPERHDPLRTRPDDRRRSTSTASCTSSTTSTSSTPASSSPAPP